MTGRPSLRALSQVQFSIAQWALATGMLFEMLALVIGIRGALNPEQDGWSSVFLALLALATLAVRAVSEHFGGAANDILRRLDLVDGLGRQVRPIDEADLIDDAPAPVRWLACRKKDEPYFASDTPQGARRLVENLRESAWWTKRLSRNMATLMGIVMLVLIAVGVLTLMMAINGLVGRAALTRSSTWLSPLILFVIGVSPAQAGRKYAALHAKARRIQDRADDLLEGAEITEVDGLDLAAEYHLARQAAPVVPTLLYYLRRPQLNDLWKMTSGPGA